MVEFSAPNTSSRFCIIFLRVLLIFEALQLDVYPTSFDIFFLIFRVLNCYLGINSESNLCIFELHLLLSLSC